jgi:hypothetical protein
MTSSIGWKQAYLKSSRITTISTRFFEKRFSHGAVDVYLQRNNISDERNWNLWNVLELPLALCELSESNLEP